MEKARARALASYYGRKALAREQNRQQIDQSHLQQELFRSNERHVGCLLSYFPRYACIDALGKQPAFLEQAR